VSVEDDFDIRARLGVDPPCYVRKVKRATSCGKPEDPPEVRVPFVQQNVLTEDGGVLSVFYVSSGLDLIRAAVAINRERSRREDHVEDQFLLALTLTELEGVEKHRTEDGFPCHWARKNHWNVTLQVADQARIANTVANRDGFPGKFTRSKMGPARELMREHGCRSVQVNSASCVCERP